MKKEDIINAYCRIRTIDNTIPDDILDFMKEASIQALSNTSNPTKEVDIEKTVEFIEKQKAIDTAAWESWEKNNRHHPDGINPTPYVLGYKAALLYREVVDLDEVYEKGLKELGKRANISTIKEWVKEHYTLIPKQLK